MALLHRFLRINDKGETGIFTFIVTRTVTRDAHRNVTSRDFCYGHQRWAVAFAQQDKSLGIYLTWRNASEGMKVFADFTFTLLNREHFSDNIVFKAKKVRFRKEKPVQGKDQFLQLSELEARNFMDRNGEFQLEVSLSNIRSTFEHKFRISQSIFANNSKLGKFETPYFSFGLYDWSLSIYPNGRADSQLGTGEGEPGSSLTLYLNRHTGLDRTCRVKFNLRIGESAAGGDLNNLGCSAGSSGSSSGSGFGSGSGSGSDCCTESGLRDEMSDSDGKSYGWLPRVKLADMVSKGMLKLVVDMISVHTVSLAQLSVSPPNPIGVPLYDNEKRAWELEPDCNADTLRLRLVHKDAKDIPKNHIRYVCWTAYLLKKPPKLRSALGTGTGTGGVVVGGGGGDQAARDYTAKLPLDQKTYFQYYVQDETEVGTLMDTKIPLKEITDPSLGYLMNRSSVKIHIEWLQTCQLFQSTYHHYDDVTRVQNYQMRQDIEHLRLENVIQERRLDDWEQSLSSRFAGIGAGGGVGAGARGAVGGARHRLRSAAEDEYDESEN